MLLSQQGLRPTLHSQPSQAPALLKAQTLTWSTRASQPGPYTPLSDALMSSEARVAGSHNDASLRLNTIQQHPSRDNYQEHLSKKIRPELKIPKTCSAITTYEQALTGFENRVQTLPIFIRTPQQPCYNPPSPAEWLTANGRTPLLKQNAAQLATSRIRATWVPSVGCAGPDDIV